MPSILFSYCIMYVYHIYKFICVFWHILVQSLEEEVNVNTLASRSPYLTPAPPERFARIARVTLAPPYTFEFPDIEKIVLF